MKLNYFSVACSLLKVGVFKVKIPLAISWALTARCNQKCLYCRIWEHQLQELGTLDILSMIDQLVQLGTKWISFTGGEPLLREDIGKIVKYAKSKGIYVSVSTNGRLIPEKIEDLRGIDRVKLSLDGPKKIHDYIRGKGSFDEVVTAIELCQSEYIPVRLECVLCKYNLNYVSYLINLATKYKLIISFQPATTSLLWSDESNLFSAPREKYQKAINELIRLKERKAPIYNSLAGLKHLYYWPTPRKIMCGGGRLIVDVVPDGTLLPCNRFFHKIYKNKGRKNLINIREAVSKLPSLSNCKECWCSSLVEFNLMLSSNINAIINFLNTY